MALHRFGVLFAVFAYACSAAAIGPGPGTTPPASPAAAPAKPPAHVVAPKELTVPAAPDFAGLTAAKVADVPDGRTLVVQGPKGQEIVALLGVEPIRAGESAAATHAAIDALRDLAVGEMVYLIDHENGPRTDGQGRRACYVYRAPEGLLINLELIRQGYATASAEFAYQYLETFKQWQAKAVATSRGLHALHTSASNGDAPTPTAPANATPGAGTPAAPTNLAPATGTMVYVTRSGTKYHTATCRHASSATAISLTDAKARGLEPCSQCSPPK